MPSCETLVGTGTTTIDTYGPFKFAAEKVMKEKRSQWKGLLRGYSPPLPEKRKTVLFYSRNSVDAIDFSITYDSIAMQCSAVLLRSLHNMKTTRSIARHFHVKIGWLMRSSRVHFYIIHELVVDENFYGENWRRLLD